MPRWVTGIIIGAGVLLIACASFAYVLRHRADSAVAREIASVVAPQVVASISPSDIALGQLVLTEDDLDINNALSLDGSCGFTLSNDGTQIYGVTTEITPAGITFDCASINTYSAVPVVEDGRVELTEIESANSLMKFIFSKDSLGKGFEQGVNSALETKGLTPISITLANGTMTILTEKAVS
jgi:hypothetical protein